MKRQIIIGIVSGLLAIVLLASVKHRGRHRHGGEVQFPELGESVPLSGPTPAPPATIPTSLDRVIKDLEFQDTPLVEVFESIRRTSGLNIVVSWDYLGSVSRQTPLSLRARDVSVDKALWLVCDAVQDPLVPIGFEVYQGVVRVGPLENLSPKVVTKIHDVRDLMIKSLNFRRSFDAARPPTTAPKSQWPSTRPPPPPRSIEWSEEEIAEDLRTVIAESIDRDSWMDNGGRFGSIRYCFGMMVVVNTIDNHAQIEHFLTQLRQQWASTP